MFGVRHNELDAADPSTPSPMHPPNPLHPIHSSFLMPAEARGLDRNANHVSSES